MDFSESRANQMLREMCREFAVNEFMPRYEEAINTEEFPSWITKRMGTLGLIGLTIPEKDGGNNMGHIAAATAIEELAYWYPSLGTHLRGYRLTPQVLSLFGTKEQKERFMPGLISGDIMGSLATTEATGGSMPTVCATTAKKFGDRYIVNGSKVMITRGVASNVLCISAREGDQLHCLIVEKGMKGLSYGRRETMSGVNSINPVDEIFFEDMEVPVENRIGQEGKGLAPLLSGITIVGRLGGAASCLGMARWAYETAKKYAKERYIGGKHRLVDQPTAGGLLAEMELELEAARYFTYRYAWLMDSGIPARAIAKEGSMAKLTASQSAIHNCTKAIELHGGYGTTKEFKIIGRLHSALDMMSAAGSDNIMRHNLALAQAADE